MTGATNGACLNLQGIHATVGAVGPAPQQWEEPRMTSIGLGRRDLIKSALYGGAALTLGGAFRPAMAAEAVSFADIGVGDPGGDWSRYGKATGGNTVNLVSIGNAPSAILNVLITGGGTKTYDIINIVGG